MTDFAKAAAELETMHGKAGALACCVSPLGGVVIEMRAAAGVVSVALDGGQVLGWVAPDGRELLWLSPLAQLGGPKAVRGGIPICWPWFGPTPPDAASSQGWPQHGLVRTKRWRIVGTSAESGIVELQLATTATETDCPGWPHSAEAMLTVALSDTLSLTLETRNRGQRTLPITQALHTYFAVGDIGAVQVTGFEGLRFEDKATPHGDLRLQSGPVVIASEVDRIYVGHSGRATLEDRSCGGQIIIEKSGSSSTVLWNPWADKAARLGDMNRPGEADGYRRMVCVETANTLHDIVRIAPDGTATLTATYRYLPL